MPQIRNSRTIDAFCIVLTLAALFVILSSIRPWPPRTNHSLHRAIGVALARQALALLGPGGQIVVITRETETFRQPALDLLLEAFEKEVRHASVKTAAIQRLQLDPLRPVEVPSGDFYERLRRAPPGQVIVSLLGPPLLSEAQWRQLQPIRAKIVAFCPGGTGRSVDLGRWFEAGFLHAAIVSRPPAAKASGNSQKEPDSFDELYIQVTAADRSRLPAASDSNL